MKTPEKLAKEVFDALEEAEGEQLCGTVFRSQNEKIIAAAIREAVAEERESCAKLVEPESEGGWHGSLTVSDNGNVSGGYIGERLALKIRRRKSK